MGKLVRGVNDLSTWCATHIDRGSSIINEFIGLDSENNKVSIDNISYGSKKKLKWKCEHCKNIYVAAVYSRTVNGTGCKKCGNIRGAKKKIAEKIYNNKASLFDWCKRNGLYGELLLSEWQGKDANGELIDINKVAYGSRILVSWKCLKNENHVWKTKIYSRTGRPRLCPFCSNKRVDKGVNDLYTWICEHNKQMLNEWVGLDTDGDRIDINEVSYSSHKKVKWQCTTNSEHVWEATINSRTNQGLGCPHCNIKGTSFTEQILYFYYKKLYPGTMSRGIYNGYEFDIAIPELRTCIEYNGLWWHSKYETICRDDIKRKLCKKHNVKLIVILEDDERYTLDKDLVYFNYCINRRYKREDTELYDLISSINKELHIEDCNILVNILEATKQTKIFLGIGDNKHE